MSSSVPYPEPHTKDRHGDVGEAETVGFCSFDNQPRILLSEFQVDVSSLSLKEQGRQCHGEQHSRLTSGFHTHICTHVHKCVHTYAPTHFKSLFPVVNNAPHRHGRSQGVQGRRSRNGKRTIPTWRFILHRIGFPYLIPPPPTKIRLSRQ